MFDLLCGIPSVLIDRDPNVANRRKQYGRAGDYRYQPHGIEYRTLSNFWIKDFKLMHLFTGLARTAFLICSSDTNQGTHIMKDLWKLVDQKDVIDAINNSDYKLARDIWLKIESYIVAIGDNDQTHYPISSATIRGFKQFIIDGVKKHTNNDPIKHWVGTLSSSRTAWETYASRMNVHSDIDNIFKNTIKE
jgi:hypothetical protein